MGTKISYSKYILLFPMHFNLNNGVLTPICSWRALVCQSFWEEACKFEVNVKGSNWAVPLLLKEVKSAPAIERKLSNCAEHTVV